ncbi:MAG: glycosyltransferase, partial [Syntrophomonadaceae bacterium]|nr:glycosyltransferase [Syntrophomonadaceae bacterium]
MKIIITGGGTGGHIYPAIAIAQEIRDRLPEAQILYVGTKEGMES